MFFSCFGLAASERDENALELLSRSARSHQADLQKYRNCAGTGTIEWIHADGEQFWTCDLSFAIQGSKLQMSLLTISRKATLMPFDRAQVVADGETLAVMRHSSTIRPAGCEMWVFDDDSKGLKLAAVHGRVDMRVRMVPPLLTVDPVAGLEKHDATVRFGEEPDSVVVEYPGQRWVYEFSEEHEFRVVKVEAYGHAGDMPNSIETFTYHPESHEVWTYVFARINRPSRNGYHRIALSLDEVSVLADGYDFTLSSFDKCDGSRLVDHRKSSAVLLRSVPAAELNNGSISQQIEAMSEQAVAGRPERRARPVDSSGVWGKRLIWINVSFLTVLLLRWMLLRRRR